MSDPVDFSKCPIVQGRVYGGANGKKIAVEYNGSVYMLKFPSTLINKPTSLSYSNSPVSEYIGSNIYSMVGVDVQETILGTYSVNEKNKVVCACKDFTQDGSRFFDFCSLKNTVLDSDSNGSGTELADILDTIDKQAYFDPDVLKCRFWDMFVVDSLIGNFDRHNGNWGFLYSDCEKSARLAPVFDCGSSLLSWADEDTMKRVLSNENELLARVYRYPVSAIKINGKKINYYSFLSSADSDDVRNSVMRIAPNINIKKISNFIDDIPILSDTYKEFYKTFLSARNELIIQPAYRRLMKALLDKETSPSHGGVAGYRKDKRKDALLCDKSKDEGR